VLQRQVYPRSEEAGRENEAADLDFEAGIGPWVPVHDQTTDISHHLPKYAYAYGDHEGPCSRPGSDDDLRDEEEAEERCEEGIGAEVWIVTIECVADRTKDRHGIAGIVAVLSHVGCGGEGGSRMGVEGCRLKVEGCARRQEEAYTG